MSPSASPSVPAGQACAILAPAVAEAARRAGATEVGLVDLEGGTAPGTALTLHLDQVRVTYGDGHVLGDPTAATRLVCRVVGGRAVPATPVPAVVARVALRGVRGDPAARLAEALDAVPADALPVVVTAWTLSRLVPATRHRVVEALRTAGRPLAWVSVEGVGVAPTVPTLGDRPASGHSIVGLALLDGTGSEVRPDAVARCWSRGRVLAWLAEGAPA